MTLPSASTVSELFAKLSQLVDENERLQTENEHLKNETGNRNLEPEMKHQIMEKETPPNEGKNLTPKKKKRTNSQFTKQIMDDDVKQQA